MHEKKNGEKLTNSKILSFSGNKIVVGTLEDHSNHGRDIGKGIKPNLWKA